MKLQKAAYVLMGLVFFLANASFAQQVKTDLGPNTVTIATNMTDYNPDSTWHQVD